MSLHRQLRRYRYLLALGAVVAVAIGVRFGAALLVSAFVSGDAPAWLPRAGTTGGTVTNYLLAVRAFAVLVVPAAAFWLGYRHAQVRA